MKMRSAVSSVPFTATFFSATKRAWSSYTVQPSSVFSDRSTPLREGATTASFRALTAFMSTLTAPSTLTPYSAARRNTCAAEKLAFDDRDLPVCRHQSPCQGRPGLAGANDNRVVVGHARPPISVVSDSLPPGPVIQGDELYGVLA